MDGSPNLDGYVGVSDGARIVGIATVNLWRAAKKGRVRTVSFGNRYLYHVDDINALKRAREEAMLEGASVRKVS